MQLTQESRWEYWLIMLNAWGLAALLLLLHTLAMRDYIARVDGMGLRGAPGASTPLRRACPTLYADAQTWVRYALSLEEGHQTRLRFTDIDNAPYGREVHWNSAFAWLIAAWGRLRNAKTGETLPLATERALAWFNFPLLLGLVVLLSAWTGRRAGAGAGMLVALAMVGHSDFYSGFGPNYVDHHGLLAAAVFGMMLGAVFMGGGWLTAAGRSPAALLPVSRESARTAAIFSALCGAAGLWLSAASVITPIAIVGGAGVGAVWLCGRAMRREGAKFDPALWRLWGRVGAGASLLLYFIEYAPAHLGLRLEVNQPLYALAWWGGGELIAQLAERRLSDSGQRPPGARRLLLPIIALAAVPITILLGGATVFALRDPFLAGLHARIKEFLSLPAAIRTTGWSVFFGHFNWNLLPVPVAIALLCRRRKPDRVMLWFALLATTGFIALACAQMRWWLNASGPEICLLLVVFAAIGQKWSNRLRWVLVPAAAALLFLPPSISRVRDLREMTRRGAIDRIDIFQPLFRDVAAALRASQPSGEIVLLASPNASTGVGYYGRFRTLGTLYWENGDGLKAAAAIFSALSEDEALKLILERGVSHIAMISEANFLAEYFELLHPDATDEDFRRSFGYQLLVKQRLPDWLEAIPYGLPPDLKELAVRVMLLKVAINQSKPQALYHLALAQAAAGQADSAEKSLDEVIALAPDAPEAWLSKGELLADRGAVDAAVEAMKNGIARASAPDRTRLYTAAGNLFYRKHAPGAAIGLYREGLALGFDALTASNLAWLLATSNDTALRVGREALSLAERCVQSNPGDPSFLNALAAALAENGRFQEAAETAAHALALARNSGDNGVVTQLEQRLKAYQSGKPWRQ